VQALHGMGLRVVMDVVYNHTNAAGVDDKSVLDRIVPWYYHRLNVNTGAVETSTCCSNTATENKMMAKLMTDTLVTWASQYKIDSFRFDLMGVQPLQAMKDALAAVKAVDEDMYFYGEGWNLGDGVEKRFVPSYQVNLAGTGIGSFSDRMRDAVRGGSPFDSGEAIRKAQGFANGLYTNPNEVAMEEADAKKELLLSADQIMVELTGNLKDFALIDHTGETVRGSGVKYGTAPSGYTDSPLEVISYVSKHDNQTLWDNNAYKLPTDATSLDRTRAQVFALSFPLMGQGVPFIHMGSDLLRSKSMERDSYDSGDWYNEVDFTMASTAWNRGLPREDKDGTNWPLIKEIIANSNSTPTASDIELGATVFQELLSVRKSSPLFTLGTKDAVMKRVDFHNVGPDQTPGVIVMSIDDGTAAGADLDPSYDAVVVVFNGSNATYTKELVAGLELHPTLAASVDSTYGEVMVTDATVSVPAMTTAVFVLPQGSAQGAGIPVAAKSFANFDPFAGTTLYLRGDMNTWGTTDVAKFTGYGSYTAVAELTAGTPYGFKFASSDWNTIDIGGGKVTAGEGSLAFTEDGSNLSVTVDTTGLYAFKLDAQNEGAYTLTITSYTDTAPFGETPVYIRGFMDEWDGSSDNILTYQGKGVYSVKIAPTITESATTGFKIADGSWGSINYGAVEGNAAIGFGSAATMVSGSNTNFSMKADPGYTYTFTVDMFYAPKPTVTVTRDAVVEEACSNLPVSSETPTLGDTKLFVRGDLSSWAADTQYQLSYKGNNVYQAVFTYSGAIQFKIADDSANWTTQFYVPTSATSDTPKTGLELGTIYDAWVKAGGTPGNNTVTLPATQVSVKLTLTDPDASNAVAGSILIEECPDA